MTTLQPRARLRGETGAVITEAAIVGPLFFLLLFLIMEGGLLFRNYLSVTSASRDGALGGAAAENDSPGLSDYTILRSVGRMASALPTGTVEKVVVFKGDRTLGVDSPVPSLCLTAPTGLPGQCNVYGPADLARSKTEFATLPSAQQWRSADRDDNAGCLAYGPNDLAGTDFLGVYVVTTHNGITGFFGTSRPVTSRSVVRLEPKESVAGASNPTCS